ncbi:unnamed protein product, partial [Clavelina lepadiformis]
EIVEPAEIFPPVAGTNIEDLQPKWLVGQEMKELAPKCFSKRLKLFFYRTNHCSLPFSQINTPKHEVTRTLLTWSDKRQLR